jgi:hypothetical protein
VATNATKILGTQIAEDSITTAHIVADGLDAAVIKTGELDAGIIKTGVLDATLVTIQGGGGTSLAGNGLRVSDGTADRLVVGDLSIKGMW